jgi:hypothetical protein
MEVRLLGPLEAYQNSRLGTPSAGHPRPAAATR